MRIRSALMLLTACSLGTVSVPSLAGQDNPKNDRDPNEIICEKQTIVGSRLATRRVCGTRAEWAEKRRLDKDAIDQAQRSPCMITTTSSKGHASCY